MELEWEVKGQLYWEGFRGETLERKGARRE